MANNIRKVMEIISPDRKKKDGLPTYIRLYVEDSNRGKIRHLKVEQLDNTVELDPDEVKMMSDIVRMWRHA